MADAPDLGSDTRKNMKIQLPPLTPPLTYRSSAFATPTALRNHVETASCSRLLTESRRKVVDAAPCEGGCRSFRLVHGPMGGLISLARGARPPPLHELRSPVPAGVVVAASPARPISALPTIGSLEPRATSSLRQWTITAAIIGSFVFHRPLTHAPGVVHDRQPTGSATRPRCIPGRGEEDEHRLQVDGRVRVELVVSDRPAAVDTNLRVAVYLERTNSIIADVKAGISAGQGEVTRFPSVTTGLSSHRPPAARTSSGTQSCQ